MAVDTSSSSIKDTWNTIEKNMPIVYVQWDLVSILVKLCYDFIILNH